MQKTIVRVARNEYVELMEKVGVDIRTFVTFAEFRRSAAFCAQRRYCFCFTAGRCKAEALEIILPDDCEVIGKV